jgi:DNA-binding Xre family transcriptional regulator
MVVCIALSWYNQSMKGTWKSIASNPDTTPQHLLDRFRSKVDKTPGFGPDGKCWRWIGLPDRKSGGYGKFGYHGYSEMAHRIAYALVNGKVPYGFNVCHTCDNRMCVRPDHLYAGTHLDNMQDKYLRRRSKQEKPLPLTVCLRVNEVAAERGLTKKELCDQSGLPTKWIDGLWYNKLVHVELTVLGRVAETLGVEPGYLLKRVA